MFSLEYMNSDNYTENFPIFELKKGIFSERQISEILYSLEGKKEIPRKYSYFQEGVEYWARKSVSSIEELMIPPEKGRFSMFKAQYQLIQETIEISLKALDTYDTVNIIDVGCGTGLPAYPIISYLQQKGQLGKYIAVDIVKEMTELAISTIHKNIELDQSKTIPLVWDFEDGHFADMLVPHRDERTVNLFCFFSNTLGTMVDRHRALANLRDSMTGGDLLWIGNTLYENASKLQEMYNNLEVNSPDYYHYHSDSLALLNCFGLPWDEYGFVRIESADTRGLLQYQYEITKGFVLKINASDYQNVLLTFYPKDIITFLKFKNYKEGELIDELKDAGFRIKLFTASDDYRSALVLVSVI